MARFAFGHSGGGDWQQASRACASQLKDAAPGNIGFVYVTEQFADHCNEIVDCLRNETGLASWVGTAGMGVLATGQEYYGEPGIAAMTADLPADSFKIFRSDDDGFADLVSGTTMDSDPYYFGVVHADPRHRHLATLIPGFVAATNSFLVGGLTSSSAVFPQIAETVTDGAFSGVLFSSKVPVVSGLTQGCTPIGPSRLVTECRGNVVISLDGRPALDVLREDVGELLARDLRRLAGYIHVALPVRGSDRADYLVRNLIGIDPDRRLVAVAAPIETGEALMFCRRDAQSAREDLQRMLLDLKRRAGGQARGALYYSCVARGPNMFGAEGGEMAAIREELGDIPVVGFFCNGEISHDRLYGYTGVLSVFL